MNRIRTVTLLVAIGWSLVASAEPSWDVVKGNDTGGIISWSPEHQLLAPEWAVEHCARYKKFARTTSIHLQYGDSIAFACNWWPPFGYSTRRQD